METPQPAHAAVERQAEVEIDVSSPNRDELLEIMSGLMIDYNAMTKCLEETTAALASAEGQASAKQQECSILNDERDMLREELQDVRQQLDKKDSELEDCKIKLKWAQQAQPRPAEEKSGFVTLSAMNEQLQIAATQGLREKQQRESLQKEVAKLKNAVEEAKQQNKELQGRLTQRTQQCLVEQQQKQEIQHARGRFAAKRHASRQEKARTEQQSFARKALPTQPSAGSRGNTQVNETDMFNHMTPVLTCGDNAREPLHPVESDSSMPNSASGCISQITPGSTAATRLLSPLSGGAVTDPGFRPSPSERANAVLARVGRQEHANPAQMPPPTNSTSLTEQPSLMPMASLLKSDSLVHQASVEEVKHAPSSVMCSQVWTSLAATLSENAQLEHPCGAAKISATSFGRNGKASPQKRKCQGNCEQDSDPKRTVKPNSSALEQPHRQKQGKRPSSDRPAYKRQPWPLNKDCPERHIFRQHGDQDDQDEVRRSTSCSPQLMQQVASVEDHCSVLTAESPSTNPDAAPGEAITRPSAVSDILPVTGCQESSQKRQKDGIYSLHRDMTVFSKSCSLESNSQNENAASESEDRSSAELHQADNRAPLKESSDNFERPRRTRSRTNAAIVEAAFEPTDARMKSAGSLNSRAVSGKQSPTQLQRSFGKRPGETRAATRGVKWTPRNTVTPSPAKARTSGKASSAKKRSEWKAPSRSKSAMKPATTLPFQELKRSADFQIRASSGSQ